MALAEMVKERQDKSPINTPRDHEFAGPGVLFSESWKIYTSKFWTLLGVSFLPYLILGFASLVIFMILGFFGVLAGFSSNPTLTPITIMLILLAVLILVPLFVVVGTWQGLAFITTLRDYKENIGIFDIFKRAWPKVGSQFWILSLQSLVLMGAFLFFFIPGIIVAVWLSFSSYILVTENKTGLDALLASREYVKGKWWQVVGRMLLLGIVIVLVQLIIEVILQVPDKVVTTRDILAVFIQAVINGVIGIFSGVYSFQLFTKLKAFKGEVDLKSKSKTWLKAYGIFGAIGIPLLIIIPIVILITINPAAQFARSRDTTRQSNQDSLKVSLQMYAADHRQTFPKSLDELTPDYFSNIPVDPQTKLPYKYTPSSDLKDFELCVSFEQKGEQCVDNSPMIPIPASATDID